MIAVVLVVYDHIFPSPEKLKILFNLLDHLYLPPTPLALSPLPLYSVLIGSFSIDEGNCSENFSFEMNSCFFNLCRVYSNLLKMASVGEFPWS